MRGFDRKFREVGGDTLPLGVLVLDYCLIAAFSR